MNVNFSSPANSGIVRHLRCRASVPETVCVARSEVSCFPESVDQPCCKLGTRPDLVSWFWDQLPKKLATSCNRTVYGSPVLVHPRYGATFGFAGGTLSYALRLPAAEKDAAIEAGCRRTWNYPTYPELQIRASESDPDDIGEDWPFRQFHACERDSRLAAYVFAERADDRSSSQSYVIT